MIISTDAGRSALKIVSNESEKMLRIPSVHGVVNKGFLKNAILKKPELIVSIDGIRNHDPKEMWIIGRAAIDRLKSDQIIEINETKEFLKNAIIYTLGSLTEFDYNENIELLTQLTSNDLTRYGKSIKAALNGTKKISRYNSYGDKVEEHEYNIQTDVYLQGLCSYFDVLFTNTGDVNKDLLREIVLVVDVGHQSTDIVLVKGLSVAAIGSYPVGSGSIFYAISDLLRKENISMAAKDIEWRYIENRFFVKSRTNMLDIRDLMQEQANKTAQRLINYTLQEFASETIDKVILTGGSSKLFFDKFKTAWNFVEQPDNCQFSNCSGALKWKMFGDDLRSE